MFTGWGKILNDSPVLYQAVLEIVNQTQNTALILFLLTGFIYIYKTARDKMNRSEWDYYPEFSKLAFAILAVVFYKQWTMLIASIIIMIAQQFETASLFENFNKLVVIVMKKHETIGGGVWTSLTILGFETLAFEALIGICEFIMGLVGFGFQVIQFLMQAILWIFGPLVFAISLLEPFKGIHIKFIKGFIEVASWSIFYAIFLSLYSKIMTGMSAAYFGITNLESLSLENTDQLEVAIKIIADIEVMDFATKLLLMTTVFAIGIILIPMLASKIIGGSFEMGSTGSMWMGGFAMVASKLTGAVKGIKGLGGKT